MHRLACQLRMGELLIQWNPLNRDTSGNWHFSRLIFYLGQIMRYRRDQVADHVQLWCNSPFIYTVPVLLISIEIRTIWIYIVGSKLIRTPQLCNTSHAFCSVYTCKRASDHSFRSKILYLPIRLNSGLELTEKKRKWIFPEDGALCAPKDLRK